MGEGFLIGFLLFLGPVAGGLVPAGKLYAFYLRYFSRYV